MTDYTVKNVFELQDAYTDFLQHSEGKTVNLGAWLPSLGTLRPLVPGEFALLVAATGVGKTAALASLAYSLPDHNILFFSYELPSEQLFERGCAATSNMSAINVEQQYKKGITLPLGQMMHVYVYDDPRLQLEHIARIATAKETIEHMAGPPSLLLVDYVGLIQSERVRSRLFETITHTAQELKRIARELGLVLIASCQIPRDADMDGHLQMKPVYLTSAKGSGDLENSCQFFLGMWRPEDGRLRIAVRKATRSGAGLELDCAFHGPSLRITETAESIERNRPKEVQEEWEYDK